MDDLTNHRTLATPEAVLDTLAGLLREVIGEGWVDDLEIGRATSFAKDLELESIEFVALAERLQTVYGERVDFAGWLADKELDQIIGLSVGEVVDFVCRCLSSAPTG
jgi:acyl carrier protein